MNKFSSVFANNIEGFIEYLRINNKKVDNTIIYMRNFDKYVYNNNITEKELTRELIENWLITLKNLKRLNNPCLVIRNFAKYLILNGIEACIIDSKIYTKKCYFIPHIYTDDEIRKIFRQIDVTVKNSKYFPNNKQQIKLFFKILYSCGMRHSEVLNLKFNDIDYNENSIAIKNSKNSIERLIFVDDNIIKEIKNIEEFSKSYTDNITYLFSNFKTGFKRSIDGTISIFHRIIEDGDFDKNTYLRIHDFRHTFAVRALKKCYMNNENVYAFLPILMTYMGHTSIKSTEYYLRFTLDLYEKVENDYQIKFHDIIPNLTLNEVDDEI